MTRIMLAGSDGLANQDHQRDMWLPAAQRGGLDVTSLWVHPEAGADEVLRATRLAADHGLQLYRDPVPRLDGIDAIICCQRGREREIVLRAAQQAAVPVLLDKPTLDTTAELEALAAALPATAVVPGHHFAAHASFTRVLRAAHSGELGLLRAVHADLVVARGDGPAADGELRNLLVYSVDLARRLAGPGVLRLSADRVASGGDGTESWTVLAQSDRDVVVGLHLTRTRAGAPEILTSRLRVLGTHGSALVDLTAPELDVRLPGLRRRTPFGPDSVTRLVTALVEPDRRAELEMRLDDLAGLSRFLDGVGEAAGDRAVRELQW